jgi:hypothetical protein
VERFRNSAAKDRLKSVPTHEDLMKVVRKENRFTKETDKQVEVETRRKQLMEFQRKQAVTDTTGFKDWKRGGYGFIEDKKPDDTMRLCLENYNNLQYFTDTKERSKINMIDHTRQRLRADATAGTETGVDWIIAKGQGGDAYHDLFGLGEDKKSVCAHNETEHIAKSQYGGTCMTAFGVFSSHIKSPSLDPNKGKDKRGLGSYCSLVTTGEHAKPVRIVTYYRPSEESRHRNPRRGRQTVSAQHLRELKRQGLLKNDPSMIRRHPGIEADRCLVEDLRSWKNKGEEIILLGDFNQCIYNSELAKTLTGQDLCMEEQFRKLHGEDAPNSHMTGKLPIMGCYATSGITVKAYVIARHHAQGSVGDHRLHIIDFCTRSILGTNLPTVTKRSGRKLQYNIKNARRKYTRDLTKKSKDCHLDEQALALRTPEKFTDEIEFKRARERFDKTHCELQRCCESKCRVYRLDKMA